MSKSTSSTSHRAPRSVSNGTINQSVTELRPNAKSIQLNLIPQPQVLINVEVSFEIAKQIFRYNFTTLMNKEKNLLWRNASACFCLQPRWRLMRAWIWLTWLPPPATPVFPWLEVGVILDTPTAVHKIAGWTWFLRVQFRFSPPLTFFLFIYMELLSKCIISSLSILKKGIS